MISTVIIGLIQIALMFTERSFTFNYGESMRSVNDIIRVILTILTLVGTLLVFLQYKTLTNILFLQLVVTEKNSIFKAGLGKRFLLESLIMLIQIIPFYDFKVRFP